MAADTGDKEVKGANDHLIPRTFYFIVEHTDVFGREDKDSENRDTYHVEVGLYRVDRGNPVEPGRTMRTWVDEERSNFRVVYGQHQNQTWVDFSGAVESYPKDGVRSNNPQDPGRCLPILVMVEARVEPDVEYVGFARSHDGIQFGPWARTGQTILEFVGDSGDAVRDFCQSELKPEIDAVLGTTRVDRAGALGAGKSAKKDEEGEAVGRVNLRVDLHDYVEMARALVNGRDVPLSNYREDDDGKFHYVIETTAVLRGSCPRVEVVAENALGYRSQAITHFRPEYDAKGRVTAYVADAPGFTEEGAGNEVHKYGIRAWVIPYRLSVQENRLEVQVRVGNDPNRALYQMKPNAARFQHPYQGPELNHWPEELGSKDGSSEKNDVHREDVVVSVTVIEEDSKKKPKAVRKMIRMRSDAWSFCGNGITFPRKKRKTRLSYASPAKLGDLVQAQIVRGQYGMVDSDTSSSEGESTLWTERIVSPKGMVAGFEFRGLTRIGGLTPVPAVKNGDRLWIGAYTIQAEPMPRWEYPERHKHKDDETQWSEEEPPYPIKVAGPAQVLSDPGVKPPEASVAARVRNRNDKGIWTQPRNDEPNILTESWMENFTLAYLVESGVDDDGGDGPADADAPGRAHAFFLSSGPLRLVTQEYLPPSHPIRKTIPRHQILPNGYVSLENQDQSLSNRYRVLEVTKRLYIGETCSAQPAFAETNPRVGGPGTHRVGGLHQKADDGSVYIHNGELFQAAEDLVVKGKALDVVMGRTHLSHSMMTTPIGRNWDFVGNIRLVEMLNGDVHVMNGEARVESYLFQNPNGLGGIPVIAGVLDPVVAGLLGLAGLLHGSIPVISAKNISDATGGFKYQGLPPQSHYKSPAGLYKTMLKAYPTGMPGMPASLTGVEDARFYLADKHGTVWTFAKDIRFDNDEVDLTFGNDGAELPAGVRAQYHLLSIHGKNQNNYIRLHRDASGLLQAITDDMGRVTKLTYQPGLAGASFDTFLSTVSDFAGRTLRYERGADACGHQRNLERVDGPEKIRSRNGSANLPKGTSYEYTTKESDPAPELPVHRLASVTDARENAEDGKGRAYLSIAGWDKFGRVECQQVVSLVDSTKVEAMITGPQKRRGSSVATAPNVFTHTFAYSGSPGSGTVVHDEAGKCAHTYSVERGNGFWKVASHEVDVAFDVPASSSFKGKAETKYLYTENGEIRQVTMPSKGAHYFQHDEYGNVTEQGSKLTGSDDSKPVKRVTTEYEHDYNMPAVVKVDSYRGASSYTTYQIVTKFVNDKGNVQKIDWPKVEKLDHVDGYFLPGDCLDSDAAGEPSIFTYRAKDGLLDQSIDTRGVKTEYIYYDRAADHVPGDAHDGEGRLAAVNKNQSAFEIAKSGLKLEEFDRKLAGYGTPDAVRETDFIRAFKPDMLGNQEVTIDESGYRHEREFNNLSQVVLEKSPARARGSEATGAGETITYVYDAADGLSAVVVPENLSRDRRGGVAQHTRRTEYDSLGNVVAACVEGGSQRLSHFARHDVRGNPTDTVDQAGYKTLYQYDSRGLLLRTELQAEQVLKEDYLYDKNGNLCLHINAGGWSEALRHDACDRVIYALSAGGVLTETAYGAGSQVSKKTAYDVQSLVDDRKEAYGLALMAGGAEPADLTKMKKTTLLRAWEVSGLSSAAELEKGTVLSEVSYHRDTRGNTILERHRMTSPLGNDVQFASIWSNDDRLLARRVASSLDWLKVGGYDAMGRLRWELTYPRESSVKTLVEQTKKLRSSSGTKWTGIVGNGSEAEMKYDGVGNVVYLRNAQSELEYQYDGNGNRTVTTSLNLGRTIQQCRHNIEGRPMYEEVLPPSGGRESGTAYQTKARYYDFAGREVTNRTFNLGPENASYSQGIVTCRKFWDNGNLEGEWVKDGGDVVFGGRIYSGYSVFGPTQVESLSKNAITVETTPDPATGQAHTTIKGGGEGASVMEVRDVVYDRLGNRTEWTDANGVTFKASYDAHGQAVEIRASAIVGEESGAMHKRVFLRDGLGRTLKAWDRTSRCLADEDSTLNATFPEVENEFAYNSLGHLIKETQSIGGAAPLSVGYERTPWGAPARIQYPPVADSATPASGGAVIYHYLNDGEPLRPNRVEWYEEGNKSNKDLLPTTTLGTRSVTYSDPTAANGAATSFKRIEILHLPGMAVPAGKTQDEPAISYSFDHPWRAKASNNISQSKSFGVSDFHEKKITLGWGQNPSQTEKSVDEIHRHGHNAVTGGKGPLEKIKTTRNASMPDGAGVTRSQEDITNTERAKKTGWDVSEKMTSKSVSQSLIYEIDEIYSATRKVGATSPSSLVTNKYKEREKESHRQPLSLASDPWFRVSLPSDQKSHTFVRYKDGQSLKEPGALIYRNVFGQPMVVVDPEDGYSPRCVMVYDALGRMVTKELPATIRARFDCQPHASTLEVGPGRAYPTMKSAIEALKLVIDSGKSVKGGGGTFVFRLSASSVADFDWKTEMKPLGEVGANGVPTYPYGRIVFERSGTVAETNLGKVELECVSNITFKGVKFSGLIITDSENIVVDGCKFVSSPGNVSSITNPDKGRSKEPNELSGLLIATNSDDQASAPDSNTGRSFPKKKCNGLQVQNSEFESLGNCVVLAKLRDSSVLIANNFFYRPAEELNQKAPDGKALPDGFRAILIKKKKRHSWSRFAVVNNIFYLSHPLTDSASVISTPHLNETTPDQNEGPDETAMCYFSDFNLYRTPAEVTPEDGSLWLKYGDKHSLWVKPKVTVEELRSGNVGAGAGYPGVPATVSSHSPVLWDRDNRIRDPKKPSIGPVEANVPGTGDEVLHRYVYDGSNLAMRRTYRYVRDEKELDVSRCDVTRMLRLEPSGVGSTVYLDSDGTMDVFAVDQSGDLWSNYRAQEGKLVWPRCQYTDRTHRVDPKYLDLPWQLRNTGLLTAPELPTFSFLDYSPWHMRAMEPDYLLGRMGVLGWHGKDWDPGLILIGPQPAQPSWWEMIDWKDPLTYAYIIGGTAVAVIGGIFLAPIIAGALALGAVGTMAISGAFVVGGLGFAATGAVTRDFDSAMQSAAIGGVVGAAGGVLSYGAGSLAGYLGAESVLGPMAASSSLVMRGGALAGRSAIMGVTAYGGGFLGSAVGQLASERGVDWGLANEEGLWSAAIAATLPAAAMGQRSLRRAVFGQPKLYWHYNKAELARQISEAGLPPDTKLKDFFFKRQPGAGGKYWVINTGRRSRLTDWRIGGRRNIESRNLFGQRANKPPFDAVFELTGPEGLTAEEIASFEPVDPASIMSPHDWWKGFVGQYVYQVPGKLSHSVVRESLRLGIEVGAPNFGFAYFLGGKEI